MVCNLGSSTFDQILVDVIYLFDRILSKAITVRLNIPEPTYHVNILGLRHCSQASSILDLLIRFLAHFIHIRIWFYMLFSSVSVKTHILSPNQMHLDHLRSKSKTIRVSKASRHPHFCWGTNDLHWPGDIRTGPAAQWLRDPRELDLVAETPTIAGQSVDGCAQRRGPILVATQGAAVCFLKDWFLGTSSLAFTYC